MSKTCLAVFLAFAGAAEAYSPGPGNVVWRETFDGMSSVSESNGVDLSGRMDELPFDVPGWTGVNVRHPKNCGGAVQIGTSSANGAGALLSPAIPGGTGLTLLVEGFFPGRSSGAMPVFVVHGDATNLLSEVRFGRSLRTAVVDLPELVEESRLRFCSPTNGVDRRVRLDSVALMENYVVPLAISFTGPRDCTYENDWDWLGECGGVWDDGAACPGVLAATDKSEWNGGYSSVTNGYKYTRGGFYSAAMETTGDRALVMRATGDASCALSVTVVNHGNAAIKALEISYLGVQTFDGATNPAPRRMEAAWRTTTGTCLAPLPDDGGWTAAPNLDFEEISSVGAGSVLLSRTVRDVVAPVCGIAPGESLSFRLWLSKGANSPALGIDNLRITAQFGTRKPLLVVFR